MIKLSNKFFFDLGAILGISTYGELTLDRNIASTRFHNLVYFRFSQIIVNYLILHKIPSRTFLLSFGIFGCVFSSSRKLSSMLSNSIMRENEKILLTLVGVADFLFLRVFLEGDARRFLVPLVFAASFRAFGREALVRAISYYNVLQT